MGEDAVGVGAALGGALGSGVVHPGQYDDPAARVVAEEQAVLLKELRAEPVLLRRAKGVALAECLVSGVLWNHVEGELGDGGEAFGGVLCNPRTRYSFHQPSWHLPFSYRSPVADCRFAPNPLYGATGRAPARVLFDYVKESGQTPFSGFPFECLLGRPCLTGCVNRGLCHTRMISSLGVGQGSAMGVLRI